MAWTPEELDYLNTTGARADDSEIQKDPLKVFLEAFKGVVSSGIHLGLYKHFLYGAYNTWECQDCGAEAKLAEDIEHGEGCVVKQLFDAWEGLNGRSE